MDLTIIEQVERKEEPLTSFVQTDSYTNMIGNSFDYTFNGENKFYPFNKPKNIPSDYEIGLIIGSSGGGKSTLLKEFGTIEEIHWEKNKSIASHFKTEADAVELLSSVGLGSIPSWTKPYHVLSTGEKFRADLARTLKTGAVIDEFTSVVDRNVAKSCCVSIRKYIQRKQLKNIVFASCHKDIVEWLLPTWIFDVDTGILYDGRSLRQPTIELEIYRSNYRAWRIFENHHYLTSKINKASTCFCVKWNNAVVGFISFLTSPNGYVKNGWRVHRLVVLPDFQGMGIAKAMLTFFGEQGIKAGNRLFIKTAHIGLGTYMENSSAWLATTHNNKIRTEKEAIREEERWHGYRLDTKRKCFTYEYVGENYSAKEHIRIGVRFISDNIPYNKVEKYMDDLINDYKEKYIVFISTEVGKENYIDTYAKSRGIRREFFGNKTKYDILIEF